MFPQFDQKAFEQFAANPASFLSLIADFQRANFDAARKITENNAKAFQELASIRDPQAFVSAQPAILNAVVQENVGILTQLWQSLGQEAQALAGKKK